MQEIFDRGAFAQEFRIRRHAEFNATLPPVHSERALQFLAGLRRNRALLHHQLRAPRFGGDQPRHMIDGAQIRAAVGQRRRAHADENGVPGSNRIGHVGPKTQPALFTGFRNHYIEAGLVDGEPSGLESFQFFNVVIRANHFVPQARQASSRDQTHITGSDD